MAIAAPEGDERRPIIRAEAHMLQGQTESRPRLLHCPNDLTALAAAMMPVFHGISRAEGPFKQSPQERPRRDRSQVSLRGASGRFGAPTSRAALEDVTVMKNAVEHGGNRGYITQ